MLRVENKFCSKCCECTAHNYVGSKSDFEGDGLARGILAVITLGVTETLLRDRF